MSEPQLISASLLDLMTSFVVMLGKELLFKALWPQTLGSAFGYQGVVP